MESREVRNDFSGAADGVVQAGSIHGDVNLHLAARLPRPDQVPPAPTAFVNRTTAIRRLSALRDDARDVFGSTRVTTVTGSPGVGKTALAVHWCHKVKDDFPDGNLYIDLKGYGSVATVSAGQALDAALRAMDVPPDRIPEDLDERASLFRSLTGNRRMLLLLDNASSSEQVRRLIPSSSRSFVVVTSRSRLRGLSSREGAVRLDVDVLTPVDAMELLARLIGSSRLSEDPAAAEQIAELCGFLPLALRVVAERISSRPEDPLASVVDELVGEQSRLDAVASSEDELSDTRAVFSWSYRKLSAEQAAAFRFLGLHPTKDLSLEAAAALIGMPVTTARRTLRELADVHLVVEQQGRFSMHDLLFSYARECVSSEPTDARTRALRRCLSWYLLAADAVRRAVLPYSFDFPLVPARGLSIPAFRDSRSASLWFDKERVNLLAAIRIAHDIGQYDICWKMASTVSPLFEVQCYWAEWEQNHRLGLEAAQLLGDPIGEAAHTALLGDVAERATRFDEAEDRYREALALAQSIPLPWLEGFMHRGLGFVAEGRSDYASAATRYQQAREAFRRAEHGRGEAMATMSLGNLARLTGEPDRAVQLCANAIRKLDDLADAWSAALVRLSLAPALVDGGDEEGAIREWQLAARTFADFGDKEDEAVAAAALGDLHHRRGEHRSALSRWSRAAVLYGVLKDPRMDVMQARLAQFASGGDLTG